MLRGIIANDPRSPRPEKHGNPRNKPRRLAAALATILVIVLAPHNTQVDAGPRTKQCEMTVRPARPSERTLGEKTGLARLHPSLAIIEFSGLVGRP